MKIAEVARKSGLSAHTIRYYEKSGMVSPILRGPDGHRWFSQENMDWLDLLAALRETGMSINRMKHFAQLYQQGDATVSERKKVLQDHETHLKARQAELTKCSRLLSFKLARYEEILGDNL